MDIYHPVDGKIHYSPETVVDGFPREGYVIANEVTYKCSSLLTNTDHFYPRDSEAEDLTPTGRQVVVKIGIHGYEKTLPALPKGLKSFPAPTTDVWRYKGRGVLYRWPPVGKPKGCHISIPGERVETEPGWWRRRAINACDYFVDPLLTVIDNTFSVAVMVPAAIVALPFMPIYDHQQQQQSTCPAEPPTPKKPNH